MKKFLSFCLILILPLLTLTSCFTAAIDPNVKVDNIISDDTIVTTTNSQITTTYNKVEPACVGIEARSERTASVGSGVIYRLKDANTNGEVTDKTTNVIGYVVTNAHVVSDKNKFKVYVEEDKYYRADLVGKDTKNDIAVLKFSCQHIVGELSYIDIFSQEMHSPAIGSMALAIGCPLSLSNYNFPTQGLISKSTATQIVHSVPINPGNSGGGLFDVITGDLIGINVSKRVYTTQTDDNGHTTEIPIDSIGHAIPVWLVKKVVKDIEENNKEIVRPLLGVIVGFIVVSPEDKNTDELPTYLNSGVVIRKVEENSNASNAVCDKVTEKGLRSGDVIVKANDLKVERLDDLSYVMSTQLPGDTIYITVERKIDGVWKTLNYLIKL